MNIFNFKSCASIVNPRVRKYFFICLLSTWIVDNISNISYGESLKLLHQWEIINRFEVCKNTSDTKFTLLIWITIFVTKNSLICSKRSTKSDTAGNSSTSKELVNTLRSVFNGEITSYNRSSLTETDCRINSND